MALGSRRWPSTSLSAWTRTSSRRSEPSFIRLQAASTPCGSLSSVGRAMHSQAENMAEQTFGARFLRKFRQLGGSTTEWPSRAVDALADADRSAFRELVATGRSPIPEELAAAA